MSVQPKTQFKHALVEKNVIVIQMNNQTDLEWHIEISIE